MKINTKKKTQSTAISFQQTPNEDRTRRLITKTILQGNEEGSSEIRPLFGGRLDYNRQFNGPNFGEQGSWPLAYSSYFGSDANAKRSRRHNMDGNGDNEDGQGRLLSPSAFSRISETLGALNTVGNFLVNFTRGDNGHYHQTHNHNTHNLPANDHSIDHLDAEALSDERPMQMISSSSTMDATSVPDALLTLTKNVLGQNMTKTIEPLIKRVGMMTKVETQEQPSMGHRIDADENKRKQHETVVRKDDQDATAVAPGEF